MLTFKVGEKTYEAKEIRRITHDRVHSITVVSTTDGKYYASPDDNHENFRPLAEVMKEKGPKDQGITPKPEPEKTNDGVLDTPQG